jgi:hypothetical protein
MHGLSITLPAPLRRAAPSDTANVRDLLAHLRAARDDAKAWRERDVAAAEKARFPDGRRPSVPTLSRYLACARVVWPDVVTLAEEPGMYADGAPLTAVLAWVESIARDKRRRFGSRLVVTHDDGRGTVRLSAVDKHGRVAALTIRS